MPTRGGDRDYQAGLATVLREWGRIGVTGFGGPPTHIALLRKLCVDSRGWLDAAEFEDAIAACNLLPGPASTELAIFCAWRVRGRLGAIIGGLAFIVPGLIVILFLAALFLAGSPPLWVRGAGAGAGAAVAAVAVQAGWMLLVPSWKRATARDAGTAGRDAGTGGPDAGTGGPDAGTGGPDAGTAGPDAGTAGPDAGTAGPDAGTAGPDAGSTGPDAGSTGRARAARIRWTAYLVAGGVSAATIGPWLVLVLLGCGLFETAVRQRGRAGPRHWRWPGRWPGRRPAGMAAIAPLFPAVGGGVLASVAWVAFKVGALSFGGGFVIIPLMQADAVGRHWMTGAQFLNAVALGQITPGPVVQTVAAVGYAAAGLPGGLLASAVAFTPSFAFVLAGGRYFSRLRGNRYAQSFLDGSGPAAIGAILGSAIPLARELSVGWQFAVLAGAAVLLLALRRGVVLTLLSAAATGVLIALAGGPLPG